MREQADKINNRTIDNILTLIKKQNKTNEEFMSDIINNTYMTESRISRILDKTTKMPITVKELFCISLILGVDITTLLKDVD